MNVSQGHVQSNNIKAELVLKNGTFVTVYHLKMKHVLIAVDENPIMHGMKLICCLTKFDDKVPEVSEVMNLSPADYNYIMFHILK